MAFKVPEFEFDFGGGFVAYQYQQDAHAVCMDHIRNSNDPAYVYASVSAGKSLLMAMVAKHFQNVRYAAQKQGFTTKHKVMIIARQGELAKQDSDECWAIGVKNSIYSASINKPKNIDLLYPVICATEGTVYNELEKALATYYPSILLIDECHQFPFDDDDTQYKKIVDEFRRRNPKLKVIGYTGSPWRGSEKIKGEFWKEELVSIDRQYLTDSSFVMPTVFGFGTAHYDLELDFKPEGESNSDLSRSQLASMEKEILKEKTVTQEIMAEVAAIMKDRNLALITCSGRKHCVEAAQYLPKDEYVIITEKTSPKERLKIKERCNEGGIKYVLQIGTWTTGVSINRLDTIVILRRIGSMSLYEQLIGRGVRKLKKGETDAGVIKNECLVLDYTDTTEVMATLFNSDELDAAALVAGSDDNGKVLKDPVTCQDCGTMNIATARRCCGRDSNNKRCEYFFVSKLCKCGAANDTTARTCRSCGEWLIDPNEKLNQAHYVDSDYKEVIYWKMELTKDAKAIVVSYRLEHVEVAQEYFIFENRQQFHKAEWIKFVKSHVQDKRLHSELIGTRSVKKIIGCIGSFSCPNYITHRKNDKNKSVINRKVFHWQKSPFKEVL